MRLRQQLINLAAVVLICLPLQVWALTSIELQLEQLSDQGWSIEGLQLRLGSLGHGQQSLQLSASRLALPEPLQRLSLIDLDCPLLQVEPEQIRCPQGQARLQANQADFFSVYFSLTLKRNTVSLQIGSIAGSSASQLALDLILGDSTWSLDFKAQDLVLANLLTLGAANLSRLEGKLDLQGSVSGTRDQVTELVAQINMRNLFAGSADGRFATEALAGRADIRAVYSVSGDWVARSEIELNQGVLYVQPFYLELKEAAVNLITHSAWNQALQQLELFYVDLQHPDSGRLQGSARFDIRDKPVIKHLQAYLVSANLHNLYATYIKPFMEATALAKTQVKGQASVWLQIDNDQITRLSSQFEQLYLLDPQGSFALENGQGYVDWRRDHSMRTSRLLWQSASLYSVPFGAVDLRLTHNLNSLTLAEGTEIPILDGGFRVHQFSINDLHEDFAGYQFKGELMPIALEQLSEIMGWPTLAGSLSGTIPSVSYRKGELSIDGQLEARVFDGEVVINDLKIAGLLGLLPRLQADVQLNNLSMSELTRKFGFGAMEGCLEGYVHSLHLENWQPVAFDAWLGTPEDDDSTHSISQKAVENITSLGGGGASDVISRSVLRFFDSFGYERIGIGCRLGQGVCEMRGADVGRGGYYIVKGSGLPRIDIVGYNPRIDWAELLRRLERISDADEAVID